jgi:ABC-type sugar transport system ATPase subunit
MADENIILEIKNISKAFGAVQALENVSINFRKGEVHTLLGENGAGKSTVIKILTGVYTPDSGSIIMEGRTYHEFHPTQSREAGIAVVHQELTIFDNMMVYENVFPFGKHKAKYKTLDKKKIIELTQKGIDKFNIDISPTDKMVDLRLPSQQMVEILRALNENAKVILLDEPTSGLNAQETSQLMNTIKELRDSGITIIYISHKINEVMEISDRITVLRDGKKIDTIVNSSELTEFDLISKMVGRDFSKSIYSKKQYSVLPNAEVILEVKGITKHNSIQNVNFSLRRGEVLGVFGLEGSGTNNLSRMIFGLERFDSGELFFKNRLIEKITPERLIEEGMVYLNNNRKKAGLFFKMPIADNFAAPVLKKLSTKGILNIDTLKKHAMKYIETFSIVLNSIFNYPTSLSGGNQQKLMLSICLGTEPDCIIINEPTRGIDVGAKNEILKFVNNIAANGVGVICFSSDLPELITLSDRVIVMNSNRIAGEVIGNDITEEKIMELAAGSMLKGGEIA